VSEELHYPAGYDVALSPEGCLTVEARRNLVLLSLAKDLEIRQRGGAVERECSGLDVVVCFLFHDSMILSPSTTPPSHCTLPLMNTQDHQASCLEQELRLSIKAKQPQTSELIV